MKIRIEVEFKPAVPPDTDALVQSFHNEQMIDAILAPLQKHWDGEDVDYTVELVEDE